jgi:hypothetical protein
MGAVTGFATKSQLTTSLTTPSVLSYTATLANTEYSLILPANTKMFQVFHYSGGQLKFAFQAGDVAAGDFFPVWAGGWVSQAGITAPTISLYYEATAPGTVFKLLSWS